MKTLISLISALQKGPFVCFLFIVLLAYNTAMYAQITKIEYMKVKGSTANYLEIEKVWKSIHQARLDKGDIYAWYLIGKHFTGTASEYEYVTVTVFPSLFELNNSYPEELASADDDALLEKTMNARDLIQTEIYDTPLITEIIHLPKYLNVSFMKVSQGNDNAYLELEKNIWKPIHEKLIKEGIKSTWSVYRQLYPGGYDAQFNYFTVNGFADMKKVSFEPPEGWEEVFSIVHQGKDIDKLFENTNQLRVLIKTELWELIYSVYPK